MENDRPIVLFDAKCSFCRWSLAKLLAWDRRGRLRPVPIDSSEGGGLLTDLDEDERNASWHFVDRDGDRRSGGTAVVPMLRELPAGGPLAALLARYPGFTERAYAWVTCHRGAIGRLIPARARRRADARIERRRTSPG